MNGSPEANSFEDVYLQKDQLNSTLLSQVLSKKLIYFSSTFALNNERQFWRDWILKRTSDYFFTYFDVEIALEDFETSFSDIVERLHLNYAVLGSNPADIPN